MPEGPRFEGEDWRGARLVEVDLSGALLREVMLSGASLRGVLLNDADIDGDITGLRVNGVEVAPLVEAELDRRHPERLALRPTDADGLRHAWTVLAELWRPTMARAAALPEAVRHRRVDGEWSFAETLRHLVFVTDAWVGHAVHGHEHPFHPLGLPATFIHDGPDWGMDESASPTYADVVAARESRVDSVREYLATLGDPDVEAACGPHEHPGYPPPARRTVLACLQVVLSEEWYHHQFAVRDLAVLEADQADEG